MFNATTGRIQLNWKVLAGLAGGVLLVMLIGFLGPQEPEAVAAVPGAAVASPVRPALLAPHVVASKAPAVHPAAPMIEDPVRSREALVTAAPATRPSFAPPASGTVHAMPSAPGPGIRPMPVPPPTAPAAPAHAQAMTPPVPAAPHPAVAAAAEPPQKLPTHRPRHRNPNQDADDVAAAAPETKDEPQDQTPPSAPEAAAPETPAETSAPEAPAPAPDHEAAAPNTDAEPAPEALAADVASQPVPGAEGAHRADYLTKTYNFNLKGAEWKDVLEYFSRHTKLPIIGDTQDLTGAPDFYHPDPMTFTQAFRFLNRLLAKEQRIALLRRDHIQVIKVTGSTAWLRYLELDRMFDSYESFKAAELPDDEKCVVFYTPQTADGPSLVDAYRQFAPDYMLIQQVGDSNELMVAGQAVDVDRWLKLVQRPVVEDLRQTRRYILKSVQASDVRNMLTSMFNTQGTSSPRPQPGQAGGAPRIASDKIDIWADDKNSAILVKATARKLDEIGKMIEAIDVETPDDVSMQVYKLQHSRAEDLANTLRQVFAATVTPRPGGRPGASWWRRAASTASNVPVQVFPDSGSNSLLVVADKDAQQEVKNLVERFDAEDAGGQMVRIPLTNARAEQVTQVLQQVFQYAMRPTPKGAPLVLTPDMANNVVVAVGEPQLIAKVQDAVKQMDVANNQAFEHVVHLEHARPSEVSNALSGVFQPKPGQPGGTTRFLPVEAAGTILIVAPPSDWERIEPMIKIIDEQAQINSPQIKTFTLEHADANTAANILNQAAAAQAQRSPGAAVTRAYGDPRTNTLFVQAMPEKFDEIEALVKKLDTADAQSGTVVITLENADAAQAAQSLQPMANKPSIPGGQPIQIAAEPMTNSVIIRNANKADLDIIKERLAKMDTTFGSMASQTFHPKYLDAMDLANTLTQQYVNVPGKQPGATGVKVIASPGAVAVDAPAEIMDKISKKVVELDVPSPLAGAPLVIELKNADPNALTNILNAMYGRGPKGPIASFGASGQNLIVQAPEAYRKDIVETVKSMDTSDADSTTQIVPLVSAQAGDVAKMLQESLAAAPGKPGGMRVRISASASGNALALTGSKADVAKAVAMAQDLEKSAAEFGTVTRSYTLMASTASDVAKVIEKIAPTIQGKDGMKISADDNSNTVFVTGPATRFAEIEKAIKIMDNPDAGPGLNDVDIMTVNVNRGDPFDIAYKAQKVLDAKYGKSAPTVDSDFGTPTITVMGKKDTFKKAQEVIDALVEGAPPEKRRIAVRTTKVPADILLKALKEYSSEYVSGAVKIEESGSRKSVRPEDLIKEIGPQIRPESAPATRPSDQSTDRGPGAPLGMAPVIGALQAIALGQTAATPAPSADVQGHQGASASAGQSPSTQPNEPAAVIKVDPETQQLVVIGNDNQIDQVDDLLKMIEDAYKVDDEAFVIKVYQLEYLNATSAAQALEQVFNDAPQVVPQPPQPQPGQPPQNPQQAQLAAQRGGQPDAQREGGRGGPNGPNGRRGGQQGQQGRQPGQPQVVGGRQRLRAIADLRVNAVIVRCSPQDVTKIATFLSTIDREPTVKQDVRILQLKTLKASEAERIIKEVLHLDRSGKAGSPAVAAAAGAPHQAAVQELRQQIIELGLGGQDGKVNATLSSTDAVTVTSEDVSNTLYVAGPEDFLNVVARFVDKMDAQAAQAPSDFTVKAYPLKNAQAVDVAQQFKEMATQLMVGAGKSGSALSKFGPFSVVPDPRTNSLVVTGNPALFTMLDMMIPNIDKTADAAGNLRIIPVQGNSDLQYMAATIERLINDSAASKAQQSGTRPSQITILPDPRTNTLLVSGMPDQIAQAEKFVHDLEGLHPSRDNGYRIIRTTVDPKDIQQLLDQLQGQTSTQNAGSARTVYPSRTSYTPPSQPSARPAFNPGRGGGRQPAQGGGRQFHGRRGGGSGGSAAEPGAGAPGQPSSDAGSAGESTGDASSLGEATGDASAAMKPTRAGGGSSIWSMRAALVSMMLGQVAQPAPAEDQTPATEPSQESSTDQSPAGNTQPAPGQAPADMQPPPEAQATPPPVPEPGLNAPAAGQPAPAEPPVGGAIPQGPQASPDQSQMEQYQTRVFRPSASQPAVTAPPAQPLPPLTPEQIEQLRAANIRVTPVGPNEVIIEGPEESLNAMESLIRRMEEGAPPPTIVVIPLKNAQATPLAQQLTTMFQQIQPAGRTPRPEEKVTVVADPRSNSLIVAASPERLTEVQAIIASLDQRPVIAEVEYKVYPLKHIQAGDAATMLQGLLTKLQQQRGVQGDQFTITPDARTNTLIVTAPKPDLAQIDSLVGTLDVPPAFATAQMMIYPLHNVLAKDLVTVLNDMISAQIARAGAGAPGGAAAAKSGTETILRLKLITAEGKELPELDLEKPIKVIAEPNTNSVVVSSTPDNLKAMSDVIKLLDAYPVGESVRAWSFALQYADATELATMLTKAFQEGRGVGLRAAPTGGTAPVVPAVPTTPAGQALMFNAVVMADARTNTLVVAGRQQALDLVEELVQKLDRPGQISKFPVHVVKLDNNDAATVAPLLEKLYTQQAGGSKALADKVTIVPEPATNALLIAANNENFKTLQGLITELDSAPEVQTLVREFPLQNADATQVADALKNLFSQGVFKKGGLAGPPGEKTAKISIVAEPRTNTVIVSAKPEYWPLIDELIKRMDSPASPFPLAGNFAVIPLKHTDAVKVQATITDLLDQINKAKTAAGGKVSQPAPVVIADPRTNSLLVFGGAPMLEEIQTLVARLDQPTTTPSAEIRVYPLKEASPDQLETIINDLFQRRGAGGAAATGGTGTAAGKATPMQVYADASSNSLIVSASPEDQVLVANLVKILDVPNQTSAQVRLFPLAKAQAQTVVQMLQSIYTMRTSTTGAGAAAAPAAPTGGAAGTRTGGSTGVTFASDDRSNSVIVRAAPADMRNIEDLIRRLDTAEVQTEMGIRWVQLKRSDASDMAQMLTNFLQAQGTTGTSSYGGTYGRSYGGAYSGGTSSGQSRAMLLNFKQQNPRGEEVMRRLLREDIVITPDTRTNTLIVMAPPDSVDVLVALIESLDSISPVNVEIEIFQLQNADATQTQATLEQLFGVGKGATGTGTTSRTGTGGTAAEQRNLMLAQQGLGGAMGALPGGVAPGAALTPGATPGLGLTGLGATGLVGGIGAMQALGATGPTTAGGRPIISFTTDTRTNSLIAAGAPDYLALVRQLVEQLDSQEMAMRVNRVYDVKYAPATQLATDLTAYFKADTDRLNQLSKEIPIQSVVDQEVTVTNAKDTNKLLISVSPRYESRVMELVRELDQQPPQVMIQVLMAEVTLNNEIDWGFEFASQDLHYTKTGSGSNITAGTSVGAAGAGTGFVFSLTSEDFSLLLRTLQSESRVTVLSRPQIMVLDNQQAQIQVGDQVPVPGSSTITTTGQLQTFVNYENTGVILQVTPHITPDDFVRMAISPQISALSASTVQISEGLNAPVISQRTANTTVTVKNGETIVIGGLIRTSEGVTNTKVPLLGDIPILGYLFKSQVLTQSRDELLIVLTPRIVRTVEDSQHLSIEQRDVGNLIPYQTKRNPLWQGLQVITPAAPPALPGMPLEHAAPASQPAIYGPAPILYGPKPPSAALDEGSQDESRAQPVSYLEQRR